MWGSVFGELKTSDQRISIQGWMSFFFFFFFYKGLLVKVDGANDCGKVYALSTWRSMWISQESY